MWRLRELRAGRTYTVGENLDTAFVHYAWKDFWFFQKSPWTLNSRAHKQIGILEDRGADNGQFHKIEADVRFLMSPHCAAMNFDFYRKWSCRRVKTRVAQDFRCNGIPIAVVYIHAYFTLEDILPENGTDIPSCSLATRI